MSDQVVQGGDQEKSEADQLAEATSRRQAVRLTTVYGGRISQYGKAYACIISDVSVGGAKVKIKDAKDFALLVKNQTVQLVFERLSDYKVLNGEIAWMKPAECVVGLTFSDPELRRRVVLKLLMPNRWRIANEHAGREDVEDALGEGRE